MTYIPDDSADPGAPASGERAGSRRALGCAFEIVETLVLTLLIYLIIHNFLAQPFEVQQTSMVPTIANGEYILIDKLTPRFDGYQYGDVVVFDPPQDGFGGGDVPFIKRIIGLPGDTVSFDNGRVFVAQPGGSPVLLDEPYISRQSDGSPVATQCRLPGEQCPSEWEIPEDHYFVMGDNRDASQDSRVFGPISEDLILGRAWLRYFPLDRIGVMERPEFPRLSDDGDAWLDYPRAGSSATTQASIARP